MVVKRTGEVVDFDRERIRNAITKAIRATAQQTQWATLENGTLSTLVSDVVTEIDKRFVDLYPNVENIQDIVEKHLVKNGQYEIAKSYILYRAKHQKDREEHKDIIEKQSQLGRLTIKNKDGLKVIFDTEKLKKTIRNAASNPITGEPGQDISPSISLDDVSKETIRNLYDGATTNDIEKALILASVSFIERDPAYSKLASRLFLQRIYKEVFNGYKNRELIDSIYREKFILNLQRGVKKGVIEPKLLNFDLKKVSENLRPDRDDMFEYMGVQTLYERYFARDEEGIFETPQSFWMRVSMGLAINETNKEEKAIEFYNLISLLRFVPSTPTLFHAGTTHPQLSSCYLTTIDDDLGNIFKSLNDNAQLSKWSGGLGNDWSNIRATGAAIKSTGVESQGVIPFLKIANDVTVAINRSGKRRGATCAYLETWHLDIEDFLDLRRNTGDERRRTHDMNTANWIPDLFMKRVISNKDWTLFSPDETPDLHSLYGRKFDQRYEYYESATRSGKIKKYRIIPAIKLWRKMLSMLFETGHPWITFKDPCNIRSPQNHDGVVNSSNLCTEITLNTATDETAVCNLGSINLEKHLKISNNNFEIDQQLLSKTIHTAMRMLDNVIDINFYPTVEAKDSNLKHRPVGLGIMGLQDVLFKLDLPFEDPVTLSIMDATMEFISYHAILSSSHLAAERGQYASYIGSKWDRGILPHDSLKLLEQERGMNLSIDHRGLLDWEPVREHIRKYGMRNSNTMALAPTATISNIAGVFPSFEPQYKNIYVKSNISGEFTVINPYLVQDLRSSGLWNQEIADELKFFDGSVQKMTSLSDHYKFKYKVAFEIDPSWYLKLAAVRGKWIDQSQSLNIFMQGTSGKILSEIYIQAWELGLKTTYYLRTLAASQIEKATLGSNYGFTQKRENHKTIDETQSPKTVNSSLLNVQSNSMVKDQEELLPSQACSLDPESCEACQ